MKLFKLVKSIDYVAYPVNREVIKISESLNDDIGTLKELILSGAIGVLFDKTMLSNLIIGWLSKSKWSLLQVFTNYTGANVIIAILVALLVYCLIKKCHKNKRMKESNKNTVEKRDQLIDDFYHILIPSQIEAKSIIEQAQEAQGKDENTILLLLFQAEHEIDNTMRLLREMRLIEVDGTGQLTEDSSVLIKRIGRSAYVELLRGVLNNLSSLSNILEASYTDQTELKNRVDNHILSTIFSVISELEPEYEPLRVRIAALNNHSI